MHHVGRFTYVGSGALALVSSLWVIVVSSPLIALTRDASLRKNIIKASVLLDTAMKEVRGVHQLALAMLLPSNGTADCDPGQPLYVYRNWVWSAGDSLSLNSLDL